MTQAVNWTAGTELKPLTKAAFSQDQLKAYAAASGDHNPIHLEDKFAKEAGFPSVIVHGMLSMAYLGDGLLMNFPEKQYKVIRLRCRFKKVTFPGDTLTISGKVKSVSENGTLSLALSATNQAGETTCDGQAEVKPLNP